MIFDNIRRTYSSIQWGLFVFVLICPFLSFAQGFINYQAFIYEKVNIVQPGRDMEQMVPYASKRVYVWVEFINKDTSLFEEEHRDVLTDSMGMLNLRIGSKESDKYKNIPWSRLSQDKVFLKISWSQTISGPRYLIENSLFSVSPFSIKSNFTELSDSSRIASRADTAIFSENAIRNVVLGSSDQSLIFNLHNGNTLRSPSLANIPKPTIVSLRPGSICKGDSVFLYSGPVPDTSLFKSFWVTLSSQPDTLGTNVSSIKIVVNTDTQIVFGIQRLDSIAGLPPTSVDNINLKVTNFSNLIDSISRDTAFEKYAFCVDDALILPSVSYSKGTWRCLNPNLAEIDTSNNVKFKKAGQLTLGFFPYNGCPFDVFYFNCTVKSPSSSSITASICQGQSYVFGTQSLTAAGTYNRTIPSANGCDSVITLALTVRPNSTATISASICAGQSYVFGTQSLTAAGTYNRTIPSTNDCDSVITLALTVRQNSTAAISASICAGQSYVFGTQSLTAAGTYNRTIPSANGCDSVITLSLTVRQNSTAEISDSICAGDYYLFGGDTLRNSGSYYDTLVALNGCDSVITLGLTVRQNSTAAISDSICAGQSYAFGTQSLTAAGTYNRTILSANGCDSVITLALTVNSNNTINLSSASGTDSQTVTVNTAITNITYSTTGATGATISGLPAGVTGNWASNVVTISGRPSATGTFNYTVTMTGGCTGGNNTETGRITVSGSSSPDSR